MYPEEREKRKAERRKEKCRERERERENKFQERLSLVKIGFRRADGSPFHQSWRGWPFAKILVVKSVELGRDKP